MKYTDDDVALRVASRLEGVVKTAPDTGERFAWSGHHWGRDATADFEAASRAFIRSVSTNIKQAAQDRYPSLDEDSLRARSRAEREAEALLSGGRINSITGLVEKDPRLTVAVSEFDTDPHLLGTPSGTVDLRTGTLKESDPSDLISRATEVGFDPDAKAPQLADFLLSVMDDDVEAVDYLQRLMGSALLGNHDAQEFYLLHGDGSNGKDTLVDILNAAVGEYAGRAPENMLMQKKHDEHSAEVYFLRGRRVVWHSESNAERTLNIGRVKSFTGTSQITARPMRGNPVTFPNTWTHFLMTNHLPRLAGNDYGTLRRIVVVPFPVTFFKEEDPHRPEGSAVAVPGLAEDIVAEELPGVLAWLVEGARRYHVEGLHRPAVVDAATDEYLSGTTDAEGVWRWIQDECEEVPGEEVPTADLYASYRAFAERNKLKVASPRSWGMKLTKYGVGSGQTRIEGSKRKTRIGLRFKVFEVPSIEELNSMEVVTVAS
jgi:putative DNA primase/helicase